MCMVVRKHFAALILDLPHRLYNIKDYHTMSFTEYPLQKWPVQREFDAKNMPFRRLGPSGLRVPLFSLGGCECETLMTHSMGPS